MWRDEAWLLDMLTAARHAREHVEEVTEEEFMHSTLHQDAVVRELEVLGEAAVNVSEEVRAEHPEIPWPRIIGMRNRLAHEYFRVKLDVVWQVVTNELPQLIDLPRAIVPPEESS